MGASEPLESNNLKKRYFKPILEAAGLPDMRLYDLRHTAATLRLVNGEHPKVVQEMLEHASITLTMDTYSHVLPGMQEESAARIYTHLVRDNLADLPGVQPVEDEREALRELA